MNCRILDPGISPSYRLKIYNLQINEHGTITLGLLKEIINNRKLMDFQIMKSSSKREHFYAVFLTNYLNSYDSVIYISGVNYTESEGLIVKQYKTFTGMNVDLDQFAVNSVMFVQKNPYLIISLDNFGLIVYDLSRFEVGERIAFKDF